MRLVAAAAAAAAVAVTASARPNIVYIMTDDQDIELGGLTPMPKTRRLLGEQGKPDGAAHAGVQCFRPRDRVQGAARGAEPAARRRG
jgi:hypothetical protein